MAKDTLDLHGYQVDDVYDAVDAFIVTSNGKNLKRVRIMSGKGTGKVKQTVIQYLKQAGYPWEFEKNAGKSNEGVLVVVLD